MRPPTIPETQARARQTFRTLLWALARPGEAQSLEAKPGDVTGLLSVAEALLDVDTGFHCDEPALEAEIGWLGARRVEARRAEVVFLLEWRPSVLEQVGRATACCPGVTTTVVLACGLGGGLPLALSGPGVRGTRPLRAQGVPLEFWTRRERQPGWDLLLVSRDGLGLRAVGVPRGCRVSLVGRE